MNYNQIIIRALKDYIARMELYADVREAEGNEESRQLFAIEAAEARLALEHIENPT